VNNKTMAAGDKAKKQIEIAERRKMVASLVTRKIDQADIAATIKKQHPDWDVSQPTISRDIKWLEGQWLSDANKDVSEYKARRAPG
jgi:arginine repressor